MVNYKNKANILDKIRNMILKNASLTYKSPCKSFIEYTRK